METQRYLQEIFTVQIMRFFLSYIHVPSSIGRVVFFRIKKREKKRKESKSHDFYFPLINRKDFVIICMYTLYTTCVEKKKKEKSPRNDFDTFSARPSHFDHRLIVSPLVQTIRISQTIHFIDTALDTIVDILSPINFFFSSLEKIA